MMKAFLLFILFFYSINLLSQDKFEKEYRVNRSQIPEKSLQFIDDLNFKKKIKWYVEESNEGKTYEAKTCYLNHLYSIEFSDKGELIDIEKKVKFKELEKEVQENITKKLSEKFKKYKFKKIQIQYVGSQNQLKETIVSRSVNMNLKTSFEIVLKAKKSDNYKLYEILLNEKGDVIRMLEFRAINSINLEF